MQAFFRLVINFPLVNIFQLKLYRESSIFWIRFVIIFIYLLIWNLICFYQVEIENFQK